MLKTLDETLGGVEFRGFNFLNKERVEILRAAAGPGAKATGAAPDNDDDQDEGGSSGDDSPGGTPRWRVRLSVGERGRGDVLVKFMDEQLRLCELVDDNGDLRTATPKICDFENDTGARDNDQAVAGKSKKKTVDKERRKTTTKERDAEGSTATGADSPYTTQSPADAESIEDDEPKQGGLLEENSSSSSDDGYEQENYRKGNSSRDDRVSPPPPPEAPRYATSGADEGHHQSEPEDLKNNEGPLSGSTAAPTQEE